MANKQITLFHGEQTEMECWLRDDGTAYIQMSWVGSPEVPNWIDLDKEDVKKLIEILTGKYK